MIHQVSKIAFGGFGTSIIKTGLVFGGWLMVVFCLNAREASSPSNIDWMISNITSQWQKASVATSTVDRASLPGGVPYSGWSDAPTVISQGAHAVSVPPYLFVESAVAPNMALIPSGIFTMGAGNIFGYFTNSPVHKVSLIGFSIDIYDVTFSLWTDIRKWGEGHGYTDLPAGKMGSSTRGLATPNHPVVEVSWYDCIKWCNARSEKEGLTPVYYLNRSQTNVCKAGKFALNNESVDWSANGYRLPTEAEWEKAARGGIDNCHFFWGNSPLDGTKANYFSSGDPFDEGTTPVGYYNGKRLAAGGSKGQDMSNKYGLYDMAGNVYQWCWDYYGELSPKDVENPRGPGSGTERIMRGGCWKSRVEYMLYCVKRSSLPPDQHNDFVGFRCVRGL